VPDPISVEVWQPRHSLKQRMMLAKAGAHHTEDRFLSKAAKHHWYSERSPWTERRPEDNYNFKELQSQPPKIVILDRENPPQSRSARTIENQD
jgi:hypothetical protein